MLRILFLGNRPESLLCLKYLINHVKGIEVIACFPENGEKINKHQINHAEFIKKNKIPNIEFNDIININFDIGISVLSTKKIDSFVLNKPKLGFVNIHLGPLPRFRGSNSVYHAIKRARKDNIYKFGITMHYMDCNLDTGPIIDSTEIPILENDLAYNLFKRSKEAVLPLFIRNIHKLISSEGKIKAIKQDPNIESYFYSKKCLNHEIDLNDLPDNIYDNIRALTFPGKPMPYAKIGKYKIYLSVEENIIN